MTTAKLDHLHTLELSIYFLLLRRVTEQGCDDLPGGIRRRNARRDRRLRLVGGPRATPEPTHSLILPDLKPPRVRHQWPPCDRRHAGRCCSDEFSLFRKGFRRVECLTLGVSFNTWQPRLRRSNR